MHSQNLNFARKNIKTLQKQTQKHVRQLKHVRIEFIINYKMKFLL